MENNLLPLLKPLVLASIICSAATPLIIKLAPKLGILDDPKKRQGPSVLHTKAIPRGGGIPIFLAIFISTLLSISLDTRIGSIFLGAALLVAIGFLDDRKSINPYARLMVQFLAAGVVVASGIGIAFISNPLSLGLIDLSHPRITFNLLGEARSLWILSGLFALIWIVALMNAVNWSSGLDGQISGTVSVAAIVIALLSLRFSPDQNQLPVTIIAAATAGAYLGFLPWHIYPQKIMPGFGGATLAALSILATSKVGTLMVVLAVPLIDAAYSSLRRILSGKSPVWGDKGHLHHQLLKIGWTSKKVAAFYWLVTALLGFLALNLNAQAKLYTIITVALVVGGILLWINSLFQQSKQQDPGNG